LGPESVAESSSDDTDSDSEQLPLVGVPAPDEMRVDPTDIYYFAWFVYRGPEFMGIGIGFPNICGQIYGMAVTHTVLYHTVLDFSSHFANLTNGKPSDINQRLAKLLPEIQGTLISGQYDDGHMVAVFLLCALYHYSGNLSASAFHLEGLSLMIVHSRTRRIESKQDPTLAPMIHFIIRQCIKFFNQVSTERQKLLQFQATVGTTKWDTGWIEHFIEKPYVPAIEASYAFQDFQFAVLHLYHRATKLRRSDPYDIVIDEAAIAYDVSSLVVQIQEFQMYLKVMAYGMPLWPRPLLRADLSFPNPHPSSA
jgi:hypothetical protein